MTGSDDSGPYVCELCGETVNSDSDQDICDDCLDDSGPEFDTVSTDTVYLPEDPDAEIVGAVPIAELERLTDEVKLESHRTSDNAEAGGWYQAAEMLEELIAEYGGPDE